MTVSARDVTVSLGRRTVLEAISLDLARGTLTAVIGPNGAGKSTLLKALAGLAPPNHGTVAIDGRDIATLDLKARARAVGYLPQARTAYWPLSVERTVALGRQPHASGPAADCAAIDRAMADMDVARFRLRPVTELSGGELARVLIARVLAQETPVILADEPTAGLDPAHQIALMQRLAALAESGRTVAVAIHDLWLAARYCRRIVMLKDGRLLADGTPAAVLTSAHLKAAFGVDTRIQSMDGVPVVLPVGLC